MNFNSSQTVLLTLSTIAAALILSVSPAAQADSCHLRDVCPSGTAYEGRQVWSELGDGVSGAPAGGSSSCRDYKGVSADGRDYILLCECRSNQTNEIVHGLTSCNSGPRVWTSSKYTIKSFFDIFN